MKYILACLMCLCCGLAAAEPITIDKITVVDGDTVRVGHDRYRMIGYDTPESSTPRRKVGSNERALAYKATERLQELLRSGPIDLTEKPCACSKKKRENGTCNYKRKCAILSVNKKNVGDTLIEEGLAKRFICSQTRCPKMPNWPKIAGDR
jgi:endonuclease YncB( thermonuclease family)